MKNSRLSSHQHLIRQAAYCNKLSNAHAKPFFSSALILFILVVSSIIVVLTRGLSNAPTLPTLSPIPTSSPLPTVSPIPPLSAGITQSPISTSEACQYKNLAFIGGSITVGSNASDLSKSYVSRVYYWFKSLCGDGINIKNISIGGTSSDYAVFAVEHELAGYVPDIAFYEFAANDAGQTETYIRRNVEGLIYKLRRINSKMLIFSVLTTRVPDMEFYEAGNLPPTVDIHMRVASDNGVPAINVGQYLWEYIFKNGANIQDYLTDIVHPNDLGHQLYAEAIIEFLTPYFENNPTIPDGEKYHYSRDLANATLMDMSEMVTTTCNKVMNENEVTLLCTKGQAFSGSFTGELLGIVGEIRSDGGRLECVVDNSTEKVMDFWDDYALSFNRTSYSFLFDHLGKSQHGLTCTVLDQIISSGGGQSQGYTVKVFYLMVNPFYDVHLPLIIR